MTLPSYPNSISASQINTELGLAPNTTISLGNAAVRALLAKPTAGSSISYYDGFGKSNVPQIGVMLQAAINPVGSPAKAEIWSTNFTSQIQTVPSTGTILSNTQPFGTIPVQYISGGSGGFIDSYDGTSVLMLTSNDGSATYVRRVMRSTDGGASWSNVFVPTNSNNSTLSQWGRNVIAARSATKATRPWVCFLGNNSQTGYTPYLCYSLDDGVNWTQISWPYNPNGNTYECNANVTWFNGKFVIMLGFNGVSNTSTPTSDLLKLITSTNGVTWSTGTMADLPAPLTPSSGGGVLQNGSVNITAYYSIATDYDQTAMAINYSYGTGKTFRIARTTNGGGSWTATDYNIVNSSLNGIYQGQVHFMGGKIFIVVLEVATPYSGTKNTYEIWRSTDAGQTFTYTTSFTAGSVASGPANTGMKLYTANGSYAVLVAFPYSTPAYNNFSGVEFTYTTDGGATWATGKCAQTTATFPNYTTGMAPMGVIRV